MEFENANNINLALEASLKKTTPSRLFSSAARYIKKLVRRAKKDCSCTCVPKTEEEMDNDINEQLEAKMAQRNTASVEPDLKNFYHISFQQIPAAQVPYS